MKSWRYGISVFSMLGNAAAGLLTSYVLVRVAGFSAGLDRIFFLTALNTVFFEFMIAPFMTSLPRFLASSEDAPGAVNQISTFIVAILTLGGAILGAVNYFLSQRYLVGWSWQEVLLVLSAISLATLFQGMLVVLQAYGVAQGRYWALDLLGLILSWLQLAAVAYWMPSRGASAYFLILLSRYALEMLILYLGAGLHIRPGLPSSEVRLYLHSTYFNQAALVLTRIDTLVDRLVLSRLLPGSLGFVTVARQFVDLVTRILYRLVVYASAIADRSGHIPVRTTALLSVSFWGIFLLCQYLILQETEPGRLVARRIFTEHFSVAELINLQIWLSGVVLATPLIHSCMIESSHRLLGRRLWYSCGIATGVFSALKLGVVSESGSHPLQLFAILVSINYCWNALTYLALRKNPAL